VLPEVPQWPTPDPNRPTPENSLSVPTPVPPVPVAEDAVNVVVLGSDQRPEWNEWHTDVVQIVSIQKSRGAVSVISIPRDLYVYIPGFWMSRINFADFYGEVYEYDGGGSRLVKDTILYNLGVRVDYYVRTNFDGLIGIVDTLGGIDIPVHCRLTDHWPYPDENGEYQILTLEPGIQHMDGETALWYARSRMTTSVFSRERRQQQVLQAIWHRARDTGRLSDIPALWEQYQNMVVTDMDFAGILELAPVAFMLQDQNVRFYNIGYAQVTPWVTPRGGSVFLPQWEAVEPVVAEAMAPVPESRMARTYMPVEVWNGTPNQDWDLLAADRLYRNGFPAIIGQPDRRDYAETHIIVFSENAKGTGIGYLQAMFEVPDSRVTYQTSEVATVGFRLILGADYQTCYLR
jgi:LCP family protein required for cell wall assembly